MNAKLEIELVGDLAGILALASNSKKPASANGDGLQTTLVAGERNYLDLLLFEISTRLLTLQHNPFK